MCYSDFIGAFFSSYFFASWSMCYFFSLSLCHGDFHMNLLCLCVCVCCWSVIIAATFALPFQYLLLFLLLFFFRRRCCCCFSFSFWIQILTFKCFSFGWLSSWNDERNGLSLCDHAVDRFIFHCIHTNTTCAMCIGCISQSRENNSVLKFLRTCCDFVCGTILSILLFFYISFFCGFFFLLLFHKSTTICCSFALFCSPFTNFETFWSFFFFFSLKWSNCFFLFFLVALFFVFLFLGKMTWKLLSFGKRYILN